MIQFGPQERFHLPVSQVTEVLPARPGRPAAEFREVLTVCGKWQRTDLDFSKATLDNLCPQCLRGKEYAVKVELKRAAASQE